MKNAKTQKNKSKRNNDMITDGTELPMITNLPNHH